MSFKLDKHGREVLDDTPVAIFVGELSSPPSMQEYVKREFEFRKWKQELNNTLETDDDYLDLDVEIKDDLDDNTQYTQNFFDYKILKDFKNDLSDAFHNNSNSAPHQEQTLEEEKKEEK